MKKDFVLGDIFEDFVSESDTIPDTEEIVPIPLERLHEDERNFYQLSRIDELAENIRFAGLQQPLRVREAEDGYTILSGHRRFAAIRALAKEGEDWESVPCIIDRSMDSPEMQEFKLILANSDTRVLTPSEITEQAKRVQELLVKLSEQGIKFKGRMRDRVAEACNISATKLARLNAIDKNLKDEALRAAYKADTIRESAAYELQKLPENLQTLVADVYTSKEGKLYVDGTRAEKIARYIGEIQEWKTCPEQHGGGTMGHDDRAAAIIHRLHKDPWSVPICWKVCCLGCTDANTCKFACAPAQKKAEVQKAEKKKQDAADRKRREEQQADEAAEIRDIWMRFAERRKAAGVSIDDYRHLINWQPSKEFFERCEAGEVKAGDTLPYSYCLSLEAVERLRMAAKAFGCSIDELIGEIEPPHNAAGSPHQSASPTDSPQGEAKKHEHQKMCKNTGCLCLRCRKDHQACCMENGHDEVGCEIREGECPDFEEEQT